MYYQQLQMLKNGTRACTDRIVRIFQSHVHPIVRGKPKFPAEFGAKIGASIVSWKSMHGKVLSTLFWVLKLMANTDNYGRKILLM